jgi:hypothetical protein
MMIDEEKSSETHKYFWKLNIVVDCQPSIWVDFRIQIVWYLVLIL